MDVQLYEFCVLYPYPFQQKEEQQLLKEIDAIFAEANGKQISKDVWGRRGLAYPIRGQTEGNFIIYYYELDPSKVREIDRALRILKGVLRHLIVKPPKGYKIASFADRYVQWQDQRKVEGEAAARAKEEALQRKVLEKAKRQAKKAAAQTAAEERKAPTVDKKDLTQEIDKLISDDSLSL